MKTPKFWYSEPTAATSLFPTLLAPLAIVFRTATFFRKRLAHPYRSTLPLICVGNAVAGGAGKTPTCIALARLLKRQGHRPVFVTRGYGGNGQLTCVDSRHHQAVDVGDEALLLAAAAPVWVSRDRVSAVRQAEKEGTVIIMDDGMQNPHVLASVNLLVIDGEKGIGNGRVIPSGPLREPFSDALSRAAAIIVIGRDRHQIAHGTGKATFSAHVQPVLPAGFPRESRFIAFAGIAHPEKFYATARAAGLELSDCWDFPDHHVFTPSDIAALCFRAEECGARLLTTEKDAVRLTGDFRDRVITLPITLQFEDPTAEIALTRLCLSSPAI